MNAKDVVTEIKELMAQIGMTRNFDHITTVLEQSVGSYVALSIIKGEYLFWKQAWDINDRETMGNIYCDALFSISASYDRHIK